MLTRRFALRLANAPRFARRSLKNDYALNALRVAAGFGHAPSVYGLGRVEKNEEDR